MDYIYTPIYSKIVYSTDAVFVKFLRVVGRTFVSYISLVRLTNMNLNRSASRRVAEILPLVILSSLNRLFISYSLHTDSVDVFVSYQ